MNNKIPKIVLLSMLLILVSSCLVIEGIFQSGIGIIVFFGIIFLAVSANIINKIIKGYKIMTHQSGNFNF